MTEPTERIRWEAKEGEKLKAAISAAFPGFQETRNALSSWMQCFQKSSNEILEDLVMLAQILAGKPVIKIDNTSLTHFKL